MFTNGQDLDADLRFTTQDGPRGGSEPDHSEESDANNDTTDYDDPPADATGPSND